ncbi:MAG: flagellar basal-body rod protein FlgF [Alphaproteobacteria bacterium]|nr:flagellar basal-body rod protein FlgF [Alphaproteobacteria bacterium]HRW28944.1 flagellar basal-body rod protein FlgF [Emcibacteraceae bacterium]
MDTKILVSLSHQVAMRRQMDIIANNIANMNTTAYKRESIMFNEYLSDIGGSLPQSFKKVSFVQEMGIARQMTNGELVTTGNVLDVAIDGEGMFKVRKPNGDIAYTRNGHFALSGDNTLITTNGGEILDDGDAPIQFPQNSDGFKIAPDGTVSAKEVGQIGKIAVYKFQNYGLLKKIGDNLYSAEEQPTTSEEYKIAQGMLETSNVSPVLEITNMIQLSRAYAQTANLINDVQQSSKQAINSITKFT